MIMISDFKSMKYLYSSFRTMLLEIIKLHHLRKMATIRGRMIFIIDSNKLQINS
jgi:hypothetical protein